MRASEVGSGTTIVYEGQDVVIASVEDNGDGVTLVFAEEIFLASGTGIVAWKLAYGDEVEVASP